MRTLGCGSLLILTLTSITWTTSHPTASNRTPFRAIPPIRKARDAGNGHDQLGPSGSGPGPSGQGSSGPEPPPRHGPSGHGPSGQGSSGPGPYGPGPSGQGTSGPEPPPGPEPSGSGPSGQGPSGPGPSGQRSPGPGPSGPGPSGQGSSGPGPYGQEPPPGPGPYGDHHDGGEHGWEEDTDTDEWFEAWWSMIDQGGEQNEEASWVADGDYGSYGEDYWSHDGQGSTTETYHTGGAGTDWYSGDASGIHWMGDDTGGHVDSDTDYQDEVSVDRTTTQGTFVAANLHSPASRLDGPPGSVCSRQVLESVFHDESVGYPCWQKERVSCWECGRDCRRTRRHCYSLTRSTCYRQERRCSQVWETKFYCCSGYQQQEDTCVREQQTSGCEVQNGGCDHFCRSDVYGNPRCECFNGYTLLDGNRCEDLDECEVNNGFCNQHCQNTEGSYYCTCLNGYRLQDHLTCTEIDECSSSNGGCAHQCYNTDGAFYCECDAGFTRFNGFQCEDVDECKMAGHCSHRCDNLPGGYVCSCPTDMWLSKADNKTCLGLGFGSPNGGDANQDPALAGSVDPQIGIAVIGGGAGGGVVLICLIVLLVYIGCRTRTANSSNRGGARTSAAGHRSSQNEEGYQLPPRVPKGGATRDPVHFDNNGYDKLDLPLPPPPPEILLPPGVHCNPYLEPTLPPSYMEATAPPPAEVHSYMALGYAANTRATAPPPSEVHSYMDIGYGDSQRPVSAVYEPMDYGHMATGYADRDVSKYGDRTPSPPPPRPSQIANTKTPSPPKVPKRSPVGKAQASPASAHPKAHEGAGPMTPIDSGQLANAMKKLKKVKK